MNPQEIEKTLARQKAEIKRQMPTPAMVREFERVLILESVYRKVFNR